MIGTVILSLWLGIVVLDAVLFVLYLTWKYKQPIQDMDFHEIARRDNIAFILLAIVSLLSFYWVIPVVRNNWHRFN